MSADMPKMPEPEAYFGVNENGRWVEAPKHCDPAGYTPMWSYDHMRAFWQEATRQAMERAAAHVERMEPDGVSDAVVQFFADAIRALLSHDTEKRHG